mmetsp:Transcript_31338/g.43471  ORF Transcript_31338/g.43471 Transcript_31338/m.43471 type:complete len:346 (-) Transcript_31338:209-1246(-)|eukprot:CAMPEP_0196583998 /NCGR_PEP_ID=MMETSP1081-20130531/45417_1 /TAXON_ID=36882 /ORGANISM="Pyramimonas amylifera, Strain CCMP720" /LENGTH=345 /DNA_ID=CAMNT_0041905063 /DNA_START=244 /DNA_END=1281 /DNA_ORIENTATION=+
MSDEQFRNKGNVKDTYKISKTIGTGGFSTVKLATDKTSGETFACKIMQLPEENGKVSNAEDFTREEIIYEINVLCGLHHENIIYLKEYYEDANKIYVITELLKGGELLDALIDKGHYTEDDARIVFIQIIKGIQYLHTQNITHRDLKLENLLLSEPACIDKVKICDFGLAKKDPIIGMKTICGSPQYVAPEILEAEKGTVYGNEVDLWSAGVILFAMLSGFPPFFDDNEPRLFRKIKRGDFSFDDSVWDIISAPARDLVKRLLTVNPKQRITCSEVLEHEWLTIAPSQDSVDLTAAKANMKATYRNKWRVTGQAVMAVAALSKGFTGLEVAENSDEAIAEGTNKH